MRKYGEDKFYIEVVEVINTCLADLYNREKYWIQYFDSTNNNIGYNIDIGGRGGDVTHLLSNDKQQEIKNKLRVYNLGKCQLKETVEKRVAKLKNRKAVTKNNITKHVPIEQIEAYLKDGWRLGRKTEDRDKSIKWQRDPIKRAQASQKISEVLKGKIKGYIRMVNLENHRVAIPPELEQEYIQKGYVRGFGQRKKAKRKGSKV